MTKTTYDLAMTMEQARDHYFAVNGFGADGGYNDAWVDFKLGPIPFPFPNTAGRKRALAYHDLHHILTGYDTDIRGEFEISAWEIGAGCESFYAAWFINLGGLVGGLCIAPRRTLRAFMRGRRTESLYGKSLPQLLDKPVAQVRSENGFDRDREGVRATAKDYAAFAAASVAGLVAGSIFMAVGCMLAPVGILWGLVRSSAQKAAPAEAPAK